MMSCSRRSISIGPVLGLCVAIASGCTSTPLARTMVRPGVSQAVRAFDSGRRFAARGDWVRAEQYFASALHHGYPDAQVVSSLLQVCIGASRLRAALGYAEIYLLRHPGNWQLRYLAACIHVALEQLPAARRALEQVLHAQAEHAPALRLLSEIERSEQLAAARAGRSMPE